MPDLTKNMLGDTGLNVTGFGFGAMEIREPPAGRFPPDDLGRGRDVGQRRVFLSAQSGSFRAKPTSAAAEVISPFNWRVNYHTGDEDGLL